MKENNRRTLLRMGQCFVLLILLSPAALAGGRCYVANVPGPIILPDNTIEEPGRLKICLSRMYSPVKGFHRTSVNGRVAGLFISHMSAENTGANDDGRPYFTFARLGSGHYELESYGWSNGSERTLYQLRLEAVRSRWQVGEANAEATQAEEDEPMRVMLVASAAP